MLEMLSTLISNATTIRLNEMVIISEPLLDRRALMGMEREQLFKSICNKV